MRLFKPRQDEYSPGKFEEMIISEMKWEEKLLRIYKGSVERRKNGYKESKADRLFGPI